MQFPQELADVIAESRRRFLGAADATAPGLRDWLNLGTGYFVASTTSTGFAVEAVDDAWSSANGADCQRFFWAARDSIVPRGPSNCDAKSIGWSSVSIYYSGLYLILGLMRAFGSGLFYLSGNDCASLAANVPGLALLQSGVYRLEIDLRVRPAISISKVNGSGFHEVFWRQADTALGDWATRMAGGGGMFSIFTQVHLQQAIIGVENFRRWLGDNSSATRRIGWMSVLRNELNYRLVRNVWSPNFKSNAVEIPRLRQDVISIVRGNSDHLGAQLHIDSDVRALIERVAMIYRVMQPMMRLPANL